MMDFFGGEWMEEVFELRWSVIYDFSADSPQSGTVVALGGGKLKGAIAAALCPSVPAETSRCQTLPQQREGGRTY